jgi:sugar lactone lactonase YvrE
MDVRCAWDMRTILGEGPVWWPERDALLFVDIKKPAIHLWSAGGERKAWPMPCEVGCIALRAKGGLVAALRSGLALVELEPLAVTTIAAPEANLPGNRFNDGKCDPMGRLWAASMDDAEKNTSGAVWRLDADHSVTRGFDGFMVGNGLGWSPDGRTMYFTDSARRIIEARAYEPATGRFGPARVFARVAEDAGYPDGLTVDADGHVWSAHWDGWRVTRYRPDGTVERVVDMPVPRPTCPAFGGKDLATLYVTSASVGLSDEQLAAAPLSGALFAFEPGVRGRPEPRFAG